MSESASTVGDNNSYIDTMLKRIKTTSYSRLDAHKRYARLNGSSLFALTVSSLLLIFVSIINKYSLCPIAYEAKIELISILVSIVILVLSLVVSLSSYSLKSERFLRTANEMLYLFERLSLLRNSDESGLEKVITEYSLLRKNSDNHQPYNYHRGRMERKNEDKKPDGDSEGKEKLGIGKASLFDNFCYWAPISLFHVISTISILIFFFMLHSSF
jgi:hypothetical protein